MSRTIFPRLKSPLAKRLIRIALALYFVVAVGLTVGQVVFEFSEQKKRLNEDIASTVAMVEPVLATALWNFDTVQIEASGEALLTQSSILGIRIDDTEENSFISLGLLGETPASTNNLTTIYQYQFPISYREGDETHEVGLLTAVSTSDVVVSRAINFFLMTIANAVVKTIALWIIFLIILEKFVSQPLGVLQRDMLNLDPALIDSNSKNHFFDDSGKNGDELVVLHNTFKRMKISIEEKNKELLHNQRDLEHKVRERTEKIEEEAAKKSLFLANMSHEIRTPMNGVLGMVELLEGTQLDNVQKKYLATVHRSGNALLNIINDILDYSKLESNKLDLENIDFDLRQLVDDSIALNSHKAQEKQLQLQAFINPKVPRYIYGDPTRLQQVINNLLNNALKFTESGQIHLNVDVVAAEDNNYHLCFRITDTGIGIDEEGIKKLFQSFSQADSSTTRKYGGTGLGLAICKQIVQLMGGAIKVESSKGNGSTFYFDIKTRAIATASQRIARGPQGSELEGAKVLLIGDNQKFNDSISKLASTWEIELSRTDCLEQGLNLMEQPVDDKPIQIVWLLDNSDNHQQQIKSIAGRVTATKPSVLVSFADGNAPALTSEPGIPHIIAVEQSIAIQGILFGMIKALEAWTEFSNGQVKAHDPEYHFSSSNLRTLIAEDNQVNQAVIIGMMKRFGVEPTMVENGLQAVEQFREASPPFDIIIMDCEMPVVDGWKATKTIRQLEQETAADPALIVGLSAHALTNHHQFASEAGMDHYLTKPVNSTCLYHLFCELASKKHLAATLIDSTDKAS